MIHHPPHGEGCEVSVIHTDEHPSPLVRLPSSHSSPDSCCSLPHTGNGGSDQGAKRERESMLLPVISSMIVGIYVDTVISQVV